MPWVPAVPVVRRLDYYRAGGVAELNAAKREYQPRGHATVLPPIFLCGFRQRHYVSIVNGYNAGSSPLEILVEKQEIIFEGRIVRLTVDTVTLPNNKIADFEIVHHPGGAAAVAIDSDNRICLLRQYRHAFAKWVWELPAGKLDPGEPPLKTAQRELIEETGVRATQWSSLGQMISSPGVFTEVVHLYLAQDLTLAEAATEEHELLEVHWVPFAEALARAAAGDIDDAKTVIALFRAVNVLREKLKTAPR